MNKTIQLRFKRVFDILLAGSLLILFSPFILIIGIGIIISMGFPVLFKQKRIGYRGEEFVIYKFRTMDDRTDSAGNPLPDAQRLTGVGKFLRSTTLDELPELVNVLKGEMSIIGPRPLLTEYRELYTPNQWRRHEMPPGMAGPVLASGRNALSWEEKFQKDLDYVDNWTLQEDFNIFFKTLVRVLKREGTSASGHVSMPKFTGTDQTRNSDENQ